MARPKLTDEGAGKPICVRLNQQLTDQLEFVGQKLDMPTSEIMRLCMRIGIEHFRRINYDAAQCIVNAVESTQSCPQQNQTTAANTAASTSTIPSNPPTSPMAANIVQLPPPLVVANLLHNTMNKAAETQTSPPIHETRNDQTTYDKPTRRPRKA